MDSVSKIKLCAKLKDEGYSVKKMIPILEVSRATVYRWLKGIRLHSLKGFIFLYSISKKGRRVRKTCPITIKRILDIRKDYRDCCGQKIQYLLATLFDIKLGLSTIYRKLKQHIGLPKKRPKYNIRGPLITGKRPGESIQVDTVDLGEVYAFTSIDTFTKQADVYISPSLLAKDGASALKRILSRFKNVHHIQRDGGSEFKAEWEVLAKQNFHSIRTSRPYKKNDQAFIEKFNATLRQECLGHIKYSLSDIPQLNRDIHDFLFYYHFKRPHMSLGMKTPFEFTNEYLSHLP